MKLRNKLLIPGFMPTKWFQFSLVITLTLLLSATSVKAQDCSDKIVEAAALYELGQFNEVVEILSFCSDSAVEERDRWQSLRLIAMAQLANKDNELARKTAIKLLEIDPSYKPSSLKDPSEFVKLLKSITVIPKLSVGLGVSMGINQTLPTVTDAYTVSDQSKVYKGLNKFQIGASSMYQFDKKYAIHTSLIVTRKAVELDHSFDNWSLSMKEKLTYLNLPITGRYTFDINSRFKPFVQVGGYGGLLIFSTNSFFAENIPTGEGYALENVTSIDRRTRIDLGLTGGIGVSYKYGPGQFFLQSNYFRSFTNIMNEDVRYKYNELFYSYFYLDDNVVLHNYSVNIGYSLYLNYKVVK